MPIVRELFMTTLGCVEFDATAVSQYTVLKRTSILYVTSGSLKVA